MYIVKAEAEQIEKIVNIKVLPMSRTILIKQGEAEDKA